MARDVVLRFRVTPQVHRFIRQAAKERGMTVSELIRAAVKAYLT